MTMKKSVIAFIAVLCLLMSTMATSFASVNGARLSTSEPWKFSETEFSAKKAWYISGSNSAGSARDVYFIHAYYQSAGQEKKTYTQDTYTKVGKGKNVSKNFASSTFSPKVYFRVLLNPYGDSTTGCSASGTQADYQI